MRIGAWIHDHDDRSPGTAVGDAAACDIVPLGGYPLDNTGWIRGPYFCVRRDDRRHTQIRNLEKNLILTAFGLRDAAGESKLDLEDIL